MGDKSPKSKDRSNKQKASAKAGQATAARAKQDSQSHVLQSPPKGRK